MDRAWATTASRGYLCRKTLGTRGSPLGTGGSWTSTESSSYPMASAGRPVSDGAQKSHIHSNSSVAATNVRSRRAMLAAGGKLRHGRHG